MSVVNQVTGYLRRRLATGEVLGEVPLQMPESRLETTAVWYCPSPSLLLRAGVAEGDWPGALHAAEHAAIGLLPLVATCDRWDIGGVSTAGHPDTGRPTVFVHDGHPGGAGFAERGHSALREWLTATRDAIAACGCTAGCPSCVQSPKCGNGNDPLDKGGAVRVLTAVLGELGPGSLGSPSALGAPGALGSTGPLGSSGAVGVVRPFRFNRPSRLVRPSRLALMSDRAAILRDIRAHGWAVRWVPATAHPVVASTIGLTALGHPELVMAGLGGPEMAALLEIAATRVRSGRRLRPDRQLHGVLASLPLAVWGRRPGVARGRCSSRRSRCRATGWRCCS